MTSLLVVLVLVFLFCGGISYSKNSCSTLYEVFLAAQKMTRFSFAENLKKVLVPIYCRRSLLKLSSAREELLQYSIKLQLIENSSDLEGRYDAYF